MPTTSNLHLACSRYVLAVCCFARPPQPCVVPCPLGLGFEVLDPRTLVQLGHPVIENMFVVALPEQHRLFRASNEHVKSPYKSTMTVLHMMLNNVEAYTCDCTFVQGHT